VRGSGISWAICKSATRSRQIPCQHPTTQFFTGRMPFLLPNQQCQSTEGIKVIFINPCISSLCVMPITLAAAHRSSCSCCLQVLQLADDVTSHKCTHNTQPFYCWSGICPGPPGSAGTRKVKPIRLKPIWIYWSKM